MKNSKLILALTLVLAAGIVMAGCDGNSIENESSSTAATESTTEVTTTEAEEETTEAVTTESVEEELKTIGDNTGSETAFEVKLTNSTEKDITAFAIKDSTEESYPDSVLSEGDAFKAKEERILYFEPEEDDTEYETEYTVELTFDDGTTAELHQFPFGDIEEGEIKLEDDTAYIVYTSLETKEEVNTLEDELAVSEESQEETYEDSYDDSNDFQYTDAPVQQPDDNTGADTPSDGGSSGDTPDDPNGGCIGDGGLFY